MKTSVVSVSGGLPGPQGPQGIQGIQGETGPQGIQGPQGPQGVQGVQGNPGIDGYTILSGIGVPGTGLGRNGDYYMDTVAKILYGPKAGGVWGNGVNIVQGPQGAPGPQGPEGPQGPQGEQGEPGVYRDVTISTAFPSGIPTNGALWFKIEEG